VAVDWDNLLVGPTVACFGEPVSYQSQSGGSAFPITGVFDEAYRELTPLGAGDVTFSDIQLGSVVTAERPVLGVQLSAFPTGSSPIQGDTIVIRGGIYVVREVRSDSHGGAKLMLNQLQAPGC
jgi:hypothetical protein